MDINEIFRRENVRLTDYPTFVFDLGANDVVRNPFDDVNRQTIIFNCPIEGFKSIEDIIKMLDESKLVVVVKDSLRPSPVPEFDFFLRYKKIK